MSKALLVGELNPYGSDPRYALYPLPERSAGGRLCRLVMGLEVRDYIRLFDRVNLCTGKWSVPAARAAAGALKDREREAKVSGGSRPVVLLGLKVCTAFGTSYVPFTLAPTDWAPLVVRLPHPSGLCRAWNEPGAFDRARQLLREVNALPEVAKS